MDAVIHENPTGLRGHLRCIRGRSARERDMTSTASEASSYTAPAGARALSPAIARALLALLIAASLAAGRLA